MFLCTLAKGNFWLILEGLSLSLSSPKKKNQEKNSFCIFFLANFGFLKQIFRTNERNIKRQIQMYLVSANVKYTAFIRLFLQGLRK
jgi:hypothetical protein